MSKALDRTTRRGGMTTPGANSGAAANVDPGRGVSMSQVSFKAKGYTYDQDIPKVFRKGAAEATALVLANKRKKEAGAVALYDKNFAHEQAISPRSDREMAKIEKQVHASGARQLDKPRKSMGRIVQRRVGWQATPTLIIITTAERELAKGADGKMRPSGEWLIESRKTYRNLDGAAQKRTGTVKDDSTPTAPTVAAAVPQAAPAAQGTPNARPAAQQDSFPEGTFALGFLPAEVRRSVIARVPEPTVFDGTSLQFQDPNTGEPTRNEVNVIRMDEKVAVVVQAVRKPGEDAWSVSQASYALGAPEVEQA